MTTRAVLALLGLSAAFGTALAAAGTISQRDKQFSQDAMTVHAGESVRIRNDDTVVHNLMVREPSGANRAGVLQKPGDVTEITFDAAGRYAVTCLIHPKMKLAVTAQ